MTIDGGKLTELEIMHDQRIHDMVEAGLLPSGQRSNVEYRDGFRVDHSKLLLDIGTGSNRHVAHFDNADVSR